MSFWIILAVVAAVYLGIIVYCLWRKARGARRSYDERQKQARGVAFQYGFFALGCTVFLFPNLMKLFPWIGLEAGSLLCLNLGITVFAVTAIWKDAYLGLHERPGETAALWGLCAVVGLGFGIFSLWSDGVLVNGVLNISAALVAVSVSALLDLAVFWYRHVAGGREEEA